MGCRECRTVARYRRQVQGSPKMRSEPSISSSKLKKSKVLVVKFSEGGKDTHMDTDEKDDTV